MEFRQRQLIAAVILAVSLVLVAYLLFLTPSETTISTPTPTSAESSGLISNVRQVEVGNARV